MTISTAPLVAALRAGQPQLMFGVRMSRTTDVVRIAKSTGHHCVLIDLEHSSMSVDTAADLASCAGDVGLTALVRVPEHEYGVIGRLLDGGAHGIIAPRIETADQARLLVSACRFPPRGHRSALSQLPHLGMVPTPSADMTTRIDSTTVVKVLIESPLGVRNADEIAAVDGIDIVGIGANDLTAELGIPGDYGDLRLRDAVAGVVSATRSHDSIAMIGGVPTGDVLRGFLSMGMAPLLLAGFDSDFVFRAASDRASQAMSWLAEPGAL